MTLRRGLSSLTRTLDSLSRRKLLTPEFERAILADDWPEEYAIKVNNKEHKFDGYFHPSGDLSKDPLQLYYKFHPDWHDKWEVERADPTLIMTWQIGSAIHAMMQGMLVHLGFCDPSEIEVSFVNEKRHVSGTIDVQRCHLASGHVIPLEIKSAYMLPKEPYPNHIDQFQVYMDLACGEEPAEEGAFVYIEKQSPHRIGEFVIQRDEARLNQIYAKLDLVREAIDLSDPSMLKPFCCNPSSTEHWKCPARNICLQGPPRTKAGK